MGLLCRLGLHSWSHQVERYVWFGRDPIVAFGTGYDRVCGKCGAVEPVGKFDRSLPTLIDMDQKQDEKHPT